VARFEARAAASNVDLEAADDTGEPLALAADRLAVERMLGNLVENAITAAARAGDGTARGSVRVSAALDRMDGGAEAVRIEVVDDGLGFPGGTAARAFERFWRGDPARSGAGSGLGLAIVRDLAEAHGGSAQAENADPRGARVSVTLPRVPWRAG
jgi:signal transduction histidine kinase